MRSFERTRRFARFDRAFALVASLGAGSMLGACGSYGDPCLRTTDCGSGLVCWEGKCVVDLGDTPGDAAPASDATVPTDASVSDTSSGNRDASDSTSETDGEETGPSGDAAGPDALRDAPAGSDADSALADGSRDADGSSTDATDARASVDSGTGTSDATTTDVGIDADSGVSVDAVVTSDATDARG